MRRINTFIDVMTEREVQMIHDNSLRILSEIGMRVPNDEVLSMCENMGGIVDDGRKTVRIPVRVVEDLLKKVQAQSRADYGKMPRDQLSVGVSTQVFYFDYATKTRRYGRMDDIFKGIRLLETLEHFPGSGAVVLPSDVPSNFADVASFHAIYAYAKKEGGTFILSPVSARYIVEMTKAMGRSCGYFLETVSPLQYRKESLEMALVMTKMGCPISIGPMVIGGALGPITIAGNCSLQNAEILGSMFVGAALTGGYSYGYGSFNHSMDMRTMTCSFGSPNQALLGMAAAQMGRYYGLWSVSNNGLTDSMLPDYQCGMEKASNAIFALLAGCGGMGGQGIAGADQGMSLEQLVLDNEFVDLYNYIMSGFSVNEETLAFDLLKEVGIGGNFIAEEHTAAHIADSYWHSGIFGRDTYDSWTAAGKKSALDRAHEYVEDVTRGYRDMEPVIPDRLYEEITRIRDEAARELAGEPRGSWPGNRNK